MNNNNTNTNKDFKKEVKIYTDYSIFNGNVRLIREGKPPIVIDRDSAIEMAHELGMNLVQIAYNKNDNPKSVCKIMNYSKFKYEQKKKEKEAKRKQRESIAEIKEIKFSIRIDDGDRNTKINKIKELLEDGDKVKLTIRLLRSEMNKLEMARDIMNGILIELDGISELDKTPSFIGNTLSCTLRRKN